MAHLGIQARGANDRLRRHAADIQAGAAEQMPLDQRDLRARCRRAVRRDESGRAGADDHQVVTLRGPWIAPTGGTHVVHALTLGGIVRECCGNVAARLRHRCPLRISHSQPPANPARRRPATT